MNAHSILLSLAGLILAVPLQGQDLAQFSGKVDALSKSIHLKVFNSEWKRTTRADNHWEQYEDYEFESNGFPFTLRFQADGFRDLDVAAKAAGGDAFLAFKQAVLLGRTLLFQRSYQRQSASARERTARALRDYHHGLEANPSQPDLDRHRKAIWDLVGQQVDLKTYLGGAAELRCTDQPFMDFPFPSRTLRVQGKLLKGTNPKMPGILFQNQDRGVERSWPVDARSGLRTLQDLQAVGLVDSTNLKCARVSQWNFIYDGWWPGHAPSQAIPFRKGMTLPGFEGGSGSVTVGSQSFGPGFVPAEAIDGKRRVLMPTFMLEAADATPMNSQLEYVRAPKGPGLAVPATFAPGLLPIAGMDEDNRIFVMSWISVAGDNGLFVLCQYDDEPQPRLAFLDSSGLVFRVFRARVEMGVKSVRTLGADGEVLHDEMLWGPNRATLAGDAGMKDRGAVQPPRFQVLEAVGPYQHEPGRVRRTGDPWRQSMTRLVMPGTLW